MKKGSRATLTPRKQARFFEALMECGNVTAAAKVARVSRDSVYRWRKVDEKFAEAWDEALELGIASLEDEATRRAHDGTLKPVFQGGKFVGEVREYSDSLLMFLLKGRRPEKYAERKSVKHSGVLGVATAKPAAHIDEMIRELEEWNGESGED